MHLEDLAAGGDLHGLTDDRHLHLAADVSSPDAVVRPGERQLPDESTLRVTLWPTVAWRGRGRLAFTLRASAGCSLAGRCFWAWVATSTPRWWMLTSPLATDTSTVSPSSHTPTG